MSVLTYFHFIQFEFWENIIFSYRVKVLYM